MGNLVKILVTFTLLLIFVLPAYASTVSQNLVQEGRSLFFNGGNFTYSGMVAANEKFKAAVTADPSDQTANLFCAVSRVAAFTLNSGSGSGIETLADLFEVFGVNRNQNDALGDFPYDEPPTKYEKYDPPATIPTGEQVRDFFNSSLVEIVDGALANLNVINQQNLKVSLTADETGDLPIEIDFGDVLLMKSILYTGKAGALFISSYDLNIGLRDEIVLFNADILQVQRDLLDKYQELLTVHPEGAVSLTNSKEAVFSAIDTFRQALTFITSETDAQEDDLFSFGSEDEAIEASQALAELIEFQNSLTRNRPVIVTEETWLLADQYGCASQLSVFKDADGNYLQGQIASAPGCAFISSDAGWVKDISVSGANIVINSFFDGWCPGTARLVGTVAGNRITDGSYEISNCLGGWSGSFTGNLRSSVTEQKVDLNYLFGNIGKNPLGIRDLLPGYDWSDQAIGGTFPMQHIANLFPEISTEKDLVRELDLTLLYDVPAATISLDGMPDDWQGIGSISDDLSDTSLPPQGGNIKSISVAHGPDYLYWMMDLNDPPSSAELPYRMRFGWGENSQFLYSTVLDNTYELYTYDQGLQVFLSLNPNDKGRSQVVEGRIHKGHLLGARKVTINGSVSSAEGWENMPSASIRLPDSTSVSGKVSCPAWDGLGKIFIKIYDGENNSTANLLGSTVLDGPGNYSIEDLPAGATAYIFARWDADDDGITTFGDFLGTTGPVVIEQGGAIVDIDITTEVDSSFILTKPGVYKVFGSNTYVFPQSWVGPQDPNQIAWNRADWTFIGEANDTTTFTAGRYYKSILIIWEGDTIFHFDSMEDLTARTAFATNTNGSASDYSWVSSGLQNFDTDITEEPDYFKGHPDGLYARTMTSPGFSVFTMPQDIVAPDTFRQLKITAVHGTEGDRDGDGIVDSSDVCPGTYDPGQADMDGDGLGDVCDYRGSIAGRITDEATGQGISGAAVNAGGDAGWGFSRSDANGYFVISGLPSGQYKLSSSAEGYVYEYFDNADWSMAALIDLTQGQDRGGFTMALAQDTDGDGIIDPSDNCPDQHNSGQHDTDGDGLGDACDPDADGDSVINEIDNCMAVPNQDQIDQNGDGFGDACTVVHCVSNSEGLQAALDTASYNGKNDVIRLVKGRYPLSQNGGSSFYYYSSEPFGLVVQGGYQTGCSVYDVEPHSTVVDGEHLMQGWVGGAFVIDEYSSSPLIGIAIENLSVINGRSTSSGGGVSVYSECGDVSIDSVVLADNAVDSIGGGLDITMTAGRVWLANSVVVDNVAQSQGGGVYLHLGLGSAYLMNNTIIGNAVANTQWGGGGGLSLYAYGQSSAVNIHNNIIRDNTAVRGGDIYAGSWSSLLPNLFNNIFDPLNVWSFNTLNAGSNMYVDPGFVDADNRDFRLAPGSLSIDAGINGEPYMPVLDIAGNWRKVDGDYDGVAIVDIGAYEFEEEHGIDHDLDGVSNAIENNAPNNGDGNDDGVPDSSQIAVTSVIAGVTGNFVTIEIAPPAADAFLSAVSVQSEADFGEDPAYDLPFGIVSFQMNNLPAGASKILRIYYHGTSDLTGYVYRKVDPHTLTWYTLPGVTFGSVAIDGNWVAYADLPLTDGGIGDADKSANGIIVDPGGPALAVCALTGDFDNDNDVDINDYNTFKQNWGWSGAAGSGHTADFDNDGDVDINDYNTFKQDWGRSCR